MFCITPDSRSGTESQLTFVRKVTGRSFGDHGRQTTVLSVEVQAVTRSVTELPDQALDDVPAYPMPRAQRCPIDPPPDLSALRSDGPLTRVRLWDGSTPWLVTRYAEQRALLSDRRVSADTTREGYPYQSEGLRARRNRAPSFIAMDDPEHARLRRMVTGAFTVR